MMTHVEGALRRFGWKSLLLLPPLATFFLVFVVGLRGCADDVPVLVDGARGNWIISPAVSGAGINVGTDQTLFVRNVDVSAPTEVALFIHAYKNATAFFDGRELPRSPSWPAAPVEVHLSLAPGAHEVAVLVQHENGKAAMLVESTWPPLASDGRWRSSKDSETFVPARLARDGPVPLQIVHPRLSATLLWRGLPILLVAWVVVFFGGRAARTWPTVVLGVAIVVVVGLAIRLPPLFGYDCTAHLAYVDALFDGRLPLADEGWQMFQPPLAYLVAAPLVKAARLVGADGMIGMRLASAAACICLLLACRKLLGSGAAVTVAAATPGFVVTAIAPGNEALTAATLGIVCAWLASRLRTENGDKPAVSGRVWLGLGLLLGASLASKPSALTAVPAVVVAVVLVAGREALRALALGAAATVVLGAPSFLRNLVVYGRPFVGGWDSSRGFAWWQEPGLRTPSAFLNVEQALLQPSYAGFDGGFLNAVLSTLWADGYWSGWVPPVPPPWDLNAMVAAVPFAAFLLVVCCAGAAVGLRQCDRSVAFAVSVIASWFIALAASWVRVPVYGAVKATYALSAAPMFIILFERGHALAKQRTPWLAAAVEVVALAFCLLSLLTFGTGLR